MFKMSVLNYLLMMCSDKERTDLLYTEHERKQVPLSSIRDKLLNIDFNYYMTFMSIFQIDPKLSLNFLELIYS